MLPYRPEDLRDLVDPPVSAAEQIARAAERQAVSDADRLAECRRVLRLANPDVDEQVITDAALTLNAYRFTSAVLDDFTPALSKLALWRYADVVRAAAAQARRAAA